MFSFQDRHLWEKHRSIPSRSLEYAERTELWGYWKYSTDLLNASDDDDLSISMDFIWFEFNLNLLAKIIHYDMLEFRLYALDAVDQLLTGGDQYRALNKLYGDSFKLYHPTVLQVRNLVDTRVNTPQTKRFREYSEENMNAISDEFIGFSRWLDEHAGKNRMQLLPRIRQLMRSVSFGTELSDDPNTLSNKFLVSLTDKLQEI
jgi:hypothetical protein